MPRGKKKEQKVVAVAEPVSPLASFSGGYAVNPSVIDPDEDERNRREYEFQFSAIQLEALMASGGYKEPSDLLRVADGSRYLAGQILSGGV